MSKGAPEGAGGQRLWTSGSVRGLLAYERDVVLLVVAGEAGEVGQTAKGRDAGEDRVGLLLSAHARSIECPAHAVDVPECLRLRAEYCTTRPCAAPQSASGHDRDHHVPPHQQPSQRQQEQSVASSYNRLFFTDVATEQKERQNGHTKALGRPASGSFASMTATQTLWDPLAVALGRPVSNRHALTGRR